MNTYTLMNKAGDVYTFINYDVTGDEVTISSEYIDEVTGNIIDVGVTRKYSREDARKHYREFKSEGAYPFNH